MKFETGGVRATLSPAPLWKRGLFGICLTLTERFVLWYEHQDIPKIIRRILERIIHLQICIGYWPDAKKYAFANQTSPRFLISFWDEKDFGMMKNGKEFLYLPPTFWIGPLMKQGLMEFSLNVFDDSRKAIYDYADLVKFVLNIIAWLARDLKIWTGKKLSKTRLLPSFINGYFALYWANKPRTWGKEVITKPDFGNFVCSTYVRAAFEFIRALRRMANLDGYKLNLGMGASAEIMVRSENKTAPGKAQEARIVIARHFKSKEHWEKLKSDNPELFKDAGPSIEKTLYNQILDPVFEQYEPSMTFPFLIPVSGYWRLEYEPGVKSKYRTVEYSGGNHVFDELD